MKKPKAFIFWVNKEGSKTPNYLLLCLNTVFRNLNEFEIIVIDDHNLEEYLPGVYDMEQLKKLSFAMQSDIISVALLEKYGGIYLDADTILTKNIYRNIDVNDSRLVCFGIENTALIHVGILISMIPGNLFLKAWREKIQLKIANFPLRLNWDYVGNSIFEELYKEPGMASHVHIKNKFTEGILLEASPYGYLTQDPRSDYLEFYFDYTEKLPEGLLERPEFGLIYLHNSWTPMMYKNASMEDTLSYPCILSKLLTKLNSEEQQLS